MIVVNWGSSNFRAHRLDADYASIAERSSAKGAATVESGRFLDALMEEVGGWIHDGESKVLMSGMVGSRYGWKEAPYVALPAALEEICAGVITLDEDALDLRIVPGLAGQDASSVAEVIRGEETEIFGSMNLAL
jgi:2-dehydro-3-deoxygalactonokinase